MNATPGHHFHGLRHWLAAAVSLLLVGCAGDMPAATEIAEQKGCIACHGGNGVGTASIYPNLNGQWQRYLRLQLHAYRDGKRENIIMQGMAANLTDQEITALAAHYGR